jgi:hypothetical protein
LGRGRKGETTSTEVGDLYSGKEGRQSASNPAEPERDQGGFIFKGRFVEAIRETLVRQDVLGILQLRWHL